MANERILVVDDHPEMVSLLRDALTDAGFQVVTATGGDEAISCLRESPFDVVLTDLRMSQTDGFDVLGAARSVNPELPVLIMTAFGNVDSAVEAMKRGAFHYFTKPFQLDEVLLLVDRALAEERLRVENRHLRRAAQDRSLLGEMVGQSQVMKQLFDLVERVASSPAPALLRGESGTGKELVARALHFEGPRRDRPFVAVNCTALPSTLLESELFGHIKGSFTGANTQRKGLFVEADGGTLFLDEIGDLSNEVQAKLLRVLETGEVRPVGADVSRKVNVRVVSATHQNLEQRIAEGKFRQDLFFRLDVLPIRLPALRDRTDDVPMLVERFVRRARERNAHAVVTRLAPETVELLRGMNWPGNVRELENFVERLVVLGREPVADVDLVAMLRPNEVAQTRSRFSSQLVTLRQMESDYIAFALDTCGGNKTKAASLLGIDVSTIHRREKGK
jgi:two-component system response regulator HydG